MQHSVSGQDTPTAAPATPAAGASTIEFFLAFIDYRYDLQRRVLTRWDNLQRSNAGKLTPGRITLRYYVNSSGQISVIEPNAGKSHLAASPTYQLAIYALALENESPTPFPELLKQKYPNGYFYEITFPHS
ncbi:MAG: hypothetical protein ACFCUX_04610 [Candidatus Methylacidiphilales bacterium]